MKPHVIQQLNSLNSQFYQVTAESFSASRQQPWQGWLELKPLFSESLEKPNAICVDVGCGNGRLVVYLTKEIKNSDWKYVGIDNSKELLNKAKESLRESSIDTQLIECDLIDFLIQNKPLPLPHKPNLITLFGVLHHVPSFELRNKLLSQLKEVAGPDTILVLTTWQFIEDEQLIKRKTDPEEVGLQTDDLEPHDYILNWERAVTALRYCHYTSDEELKRLADISGWRIEQSFAADGKSNTLNHYFVLKTK